MGVSGASHGGAWGCATRLLPRFYVDVDDEEVHLRDVPASIALGTGGRRRRRVGDGVGCAEAVFGTGE